ncbi:MAG: peptidase domain-containing ABC transporter [Erysipelotrichaceae bacterium]|nr:peptidase domain-containing ABC transporter [Erysipelotrichaceae bacterium]
MSRYANTKQHDASDCAAAVISTILETYKQELSILKIREIIGTDAYGTTVKGVVDGLKSLKFEVKAVRTTAEAITPDVTMPAIAHVRTKEGLNHFVVLHKVTKNRVFIIADPARDVMKQSEEEFKEWFTGVLVVCSPTSEFERTKLKDTGMFDLFKALILPQKNLLLTVIFASFVLSVVGILFSMFSKVLMDEIIPYQLKNSLYVFLLIFGLVSIIQSILSVFRTQVLLFLSRKIDIPLLLGYYNHILHLPYFFFVTRHVGDILTRFQDAMTIKNAFTSVSISLILDLVLSVVSAFVLVNINSTLFIILVVMIFCNMILIYLFLKPYRRINYEQMEAGSSLNSQMIESIKNVETVKSLGDEEQQIDKLETRFVHSLKIGYREGVLQNLQGFLSGLISTVGNLIFMGVGALFIIDQKMSIGDLLVFQSLSAYFTQPISNMVSLQITFQEANIAMKRLSEIMTLEREDEKEEEFLKAVDLRGNIEFKNVRFAYGSRAPVIKDLSFMIPAGRKVAFVGESGAGKSTIARLLLKFIEAQEGKITITDYDIKAINHAYLRRKIAYIPQNIELFSGTIMDNLRVGNPEATMEQMMMVCRLSGASDFIERLPNQYSSYIEEDGGNLSGGEKQRIAIARSLLSDPDLFLFDEATSNLDSFSERKIHQLIFNQIRNKTVIIIAHRLSTIVSCDWIYYMEEGKIIEQGTHAQLVALGGHYAQMVNLQVGASQPQIGQRM